MQITAIKTYFVSASNDTWVWVRMTTSEGLEGWGEITGSSNDEVTAQFIEKISGELVGLNPLDVLGNLSSYRRSSYPNNGSNRFEATAWSGIDQCLWDIKARYFGLPLYRMLGGNGKREIPLYANLNRGLLHDRRPEALLENGYKAVQEGFGMIKCTPFDEVTPAAALASMDNGIARIDRLASEVPVTAIAIDCHHRLHRTHLSYLLNYLDGLGKAPYWIEDPLSLDLLKAQEVMYQNSPHIRWAGGETAYSLKDILDLLQFRVFDVVMPDVKHCGGVSALKAIIPLIEAGGSRVSLHNPSGPIATAFSAHLLTLAANPEPLEYPWGVALERSTVMEPFERVNNGCYILNEEPGIGLKPSNEFLSECSTVWSSGSWVSEKLHSVNEGGGT